MNVTLYIPKDKKQLWRDSQALAKDSGFGGISGYIVALLESESSRISSRQTAWIEGLERKVYNLEQRVGALESAK